MNSFVKSKCVKVVKFFVFIFLFIGCQKSEDSRNNCAYENFLGNWQGIKTNNNTDPENIVVKISPCTYGVKMILNSVYFKDEVLHQKGCTIEKISKSPIAAERSMIGKLNSIGDTLTIVVETLITHELILTKQK